MSLLGPFEHARIFFAIISPFQYPNAERSPECVDIVPHTYRWWEQKLIETRYQYVEDQAGTALRGYNASIWIFFGK